MKKVHKRLRIFLQRPRNKLLFSSGNDLGNSSTCGTEMKTIVRKVNGGTSYNRKYMKTTYVNCG